MNEKSNTHFPQPTHLLVKHPESWYKLGSPKTPIGNLVKLLLIIISILLLSSPVIGQETGVLYQYETSSGIQWKPFGDGKVQPKYTGDIRNGKPDGFGILIWFDGIKYVGNFKDGKEHGQGTWTSPNGIKYEGEYKDGERNGQGTYTWKDGKKYEGEYKDGLKNGQGIFTYLYGEKYVGEVKYGKENGQGTYFYPDGRKYVGEFKNGKRNGQGTFTQLDGKKEVGGWKNGKLWNLTVYDKNGKILHKKVNGKWCKPYDGKSIIGEWIHNINHIIWKC